MNENSIPLRLRSVIVLAVVTVAAIEAPWLPETATVLAIAVFYIGIGLWALYVRTGRRELQWYLRDPISVLFANDTEELSLPQVEWAAVYSILLSFAFGFVLLALTAGFAGFDVEYIADLYRVLTRLPIIATWVVLALGVAACVRYFASDVGVAE